MVRFLIILCIFVKHSKVLWKCIADVSGTLPVVATVNTVGFLYSNKVTLKGSRLLIRVWGGGVNTHVLEEHVSLFLLNWPISCTQTVTPRSPRFFNDHDFNCHSVDWCSLTGNIYCW